MEYDNPNGSLRIWIQNWNGIEKSDMRKFQYDLYEMKKRQVQYFSIIESTVNVSNKNFQQQLKDEFQVVFPDGELLLTNTPQYKSKSRSQPGGVASAYSGKLRMRYKGQGQDKLGRWHHHPLRGWPLATENRPLAAEELGRLVA